MSEVEIFTPTYEVRDFDNMLNPQLEKVLSVLNYFKPLIEFKKKEGDIEGIRLNVFNELLEKGVMNSDIIDLIKDFSRNSIHLDPNESVFLAAIGASQDNELPTDYIESNFDDPTKSVKYYLHTVRRKIKELNEKQGSKWRLINILGNNNYAHNFIENYGELMKPDEFMRQIGTLYRIERASEEEGVQASKNEFESMRMHWALDKEITTDIFKSIMNRTTQTSANLDTFSRLITGHERLLFIYGCLINPGINQRFRNRVGFFQSDDTGESDTNLLISFFDTIVSKRLTDNNSDTEPEELKTVPVFRLSKLKIREALNGIGYNDNFIESFRFLGQRRRKSDTTDP